MVCVEGGEQFGRRKSKDELKASINTVCSAWDIYTCTLEVTS